MYKSEMTWRIRVYGIVQGVGFRPTVSRQATAHGIYGTVCNKGPYVEIYAQGKKEKIEGFLNELKENPPKRAAILKINIEDITEENELHFETFDIIESEKTKGEIFVSPDIAICDECKKSCLIQKTDDICIHLSTAPVAVQGLRFWMHCHMTENVQV